MLRVKFKKLSANAILPTNATKGAAGLDLASCEWMKVYPGETFKIRTGLAVSFDESLAMLIIPRSGLSLLYPGYLGNSPGLIDSDYRGELKIIVTNTSKESWTINPGDRIVQALVVYLPNIKCLEVEFLDQTERGESGFGSSGIST